MKGYTPLVANLKNDTSCQGGIIFFDLWIRKYLIFIKKKCIKKRPLKKGAFYLTITNYITHVRRRCL